MSHSPLLAEAIATASRRVSALRYCITVMALCATGCDVSLPGKPNPANRPVPPAERKDFAGLFAQNCSGCHGADGKLGPAPPLNDAIFLAIVPDEELLQVVANGRPGTPMPAFSKQHSGTLTDEQIKIIAKGLKQHFKQEKPPQGDLPAYALTVSGEETSPEGLQRGDALFAKACATCHNGTDASPGRLDNPALLTLFSDQALRRIIITGRPDLGMPSFADMTGRDGSFQPLTTENIDDLLALLTHWRKQPARVAVRSHSNVQSNQPIDQHPLSVRHGH